MKLNLQFFAEEDISAGAEVMESEVTTAEPSETVNPVDEGAETTETPTEETTVEEPKVDMNAIYAEARRRAEKEAKERQARADAECVRKFGHLTNPRTGQPIRSQADYFEALEAQEQMQMEKALADKGVDLNLLNQLIANNPAVRQAQEVLKQAELDRGKDLVTKDVAELSLIDPSIKTLSDVPKEVIEKVQQIPGLRITDAYKMLNYGKMTAEKQASIQQQTVNAVRSKQHLAPVNGVSTSDNLVEIPQNLKSLWEEAFPEKTPAERKALYNKQLK